MKSFAVCAAAIWFLSGFSHLSVAAPVQKRVLLLYEDRSDLLGNIVVNRVIRSVLNQGFGVNVDIRSEYTDESNVGEEQYPALRSWLAQKYTGKLFDVVVPVGGGALGFVRAYNQDLFQGAQIVFYGRKEVIDNLKPGAPVTGVVSPRSEDRVKGNLEFILRLQPDVQEVIVVSGSSATDRYFEAIARRELRQYENRTAITYLAGLSLETVQERLANLPSRRAILLLNMDEDAAGRRLLKADLLGRLNRDAAAPIYGTSVPFIDAGIIGGALASQESIANEIGRLIVRVLQGERVENIPIRDGALVPMVNWQQLRKWGIREDRLPPGTVVMFREASIWDLYRWHIIGVISLCALEAMLIVALLVHRARRKRAERSLSESRRLLQSTIDALNAQIVLLDEDGKVVTVNQSWRRFNEVNGCVGADNGVGRNYLEICESGIRRDEARIVSGALPDFIVGARADFGCIYECAEAAEKSWFQLRMNRFYTDGTPWVVMEYENVTEIKQAQDAQQQLMGLLLRAQDDERRRIARDLHDVTVQNMATIKADLARVQRASRDMEAKTLAKLDESLVLSDQVIKELRTLSYLLHPPLLDELGLIPALEWFVRGFIERSGIQVEVLVNGDIGRLTADIETVLFRVAQESLSNIHRHSGSPSASICATRDNAGVVLQIVDRGRGIAKRMSASRNEVAPSPGVGIMGMGERLRQLGGQLEIESGDQGTTVTARVPTKEMVCAS